VTSGIKDLREVIARAMERRERSERTLRRLSGQLPQVLGLV